MEAQDDMFGLPPEICTVEKDPTKSGLEDMEDASFSRYCERHYHLIQHIADVGLPLPGQQFRLVTRRVFNSVQFIEYIAEREIITNIKLAIYSINFNAAAILVDLVTRGRIIQCDILMSNLRNKAHREKEEILRKMFIDHPRISIFYCSSHAKAFSCETERGNFYTLEGSGNMAYNSRVEQYVIDNDEGMYRFSCQWMDDIKRFLAGKKELEIC